MGGGMYLHSLTTFLSFLILPSVLALVGDAARGGKSASLNLLWRVGPISRVGHSPTCLQELEMPL
ncbi:MAG TPA: hypothetical protein VGE37_16250, partial [Archangium sp.]